MLTKRLKDIKRYTFSGHETFQCKSLWLKKGYDFISKGESFNSDGGVIDLGVGRNMVSSIRFWMRSFGMTANDEATPLSHYLFDKEKGVDPYMEDLGTLWLLHYSLISTMEASIYPLFFIEFQKEKKEFTREQLFIFLKRKCSEKGNPNVYNDNTIKKDIGVLIQNYLLPDKNKHYEDYLVLLIDLNLLESHNGKVFSINYGSKQRFVPEILLYAIIDQKGGETVIAYDDLLQFASIFCFTQNELDYYLRILEDRFPYLVRFTEDSGIKQFIFLDEIDKFTLLNNYYGYNHDIQSFTEY